ncbi:MAG: hypothetical protein WD572_01685 [Gammaproteobacteria bacterium]
MNSIDTQSLTPLDTAALEEARQLAAGNTADAESLRELDREEYEALAAAIKDAGQALELCREIALTQNCVLVFQRDLLMQQIQAEQVLKK